MSLPHNTLILMQPVVLVCHRILSSKDNCVLLSYISFGVTAILARTMSRG